MQYGKKIGIQNAVNQELEPKFKIEKYKKIQNWLEM